MKSFKLPVRFSNAVQSVNNVVFSSSRRCISVESQLGIADAGWDELDEAWFVSGLVVEEGFDCILLYGKWIYGNGNDSMGLFLTLFFKILCGH